METEQVSLLLEGKRAFITGGTRGIGAAMCEVFAREGADVAFSYNSRDDLAETSRRQITAHHRRALSYKVSITDRLGMKKLTRELVEAWGGIDILVNNAAINRGDNFATMTDRAWDEVTGTNINSLFAVTKPIYKQMIRQRKGTILNITSIGA
ncbi:MAG TPA: SDR family NAD(P)-dependent oxidoreductase, partial [Pyrinomonadaceae bacterium]|nr:SDR family NAD(P)-dependent oxidoreductase [Pyrinomonadaceae bacterium]